ncbi:putative amino acid transporter [Exidia glandulosa HHB12029]|uniref:Putative amino acid transporter n=1 Tax=Exidia glandulosa HHB12029 TaxID=1314781 RepID=A0A165JMF9_EXIGL|nr:putative amino acid transporter [Exidia glandulosa HHB12029]
MADIEKTAPTKERPSSASSDVQVHPVDSGEFNASGHSDQLPRQYGLLAICATALTIDNAWVVLGGSFVVAIANGGPPGVLYELLVACAYYFVVGACIAELASSIPSAGGVYHWASVTPGPRYGRVVGFYAGHLGWWGWMFGLASIVYIPANVIIQMYAVYHPDFAQQPWHIYLTYVLVTWFCVAVVVWGNRFMPMLQTFGLFVVCIGGPVTIIVLAAMPKTHASHSFVWTDFQNVTGWSNGGAFLAGVLNGAFTIGTPDSVTHMAEELPHPRKDMPKAIFAQLGLGCITAFCFAVALMYSITDLDAVVKSPGAFPLAIVYQQATNSRGATFGLLFIILLSILNCSIGITISVSRNLWALARDQATPFPHWLGQCNERLGCPIQATVVNGILVTAFGAIALGSKVAFNDLAGSFIILTTTSYLLFIAPNLLSGRKHVPVGPFNMGPVFGPIVNGLAVALILLFNVAFCLPFALPVTADLMNYNSVILVGLALVTTLWWFFGARGRYQGPLIPKLDEKGRVVGEK